MSPVMPPRLQMEKVSVAYSHKAMALEEIDLTLQGGSICALVGVNGAGKSTLFKALLGLVPLQSGHIRLNGLKVAVALKQNLLAYVPQSEEVDWNFPIRVEDVVLMGRYGHMGFWRQPRPKDHAAVQQALIKVGMQEFAKSPIGDLSGGQKKRVFLARALAQAAPIILLDEPFTGLDVGSEEAVILLLRQLRDEGHLLIVSTHNLGSVPDYCDEVILLRQRVIAAGPVRTVFTEPNLRAAFSGMLRHLHLEGTALHDDADPRGVTVLTDDERALVLYGARSEPEIMRQPNAAPKKPDAPQREAMAKPEGEA